MQTIKTLLAKMVRWLGFAVDAASSATSGGPIGLTTEHPPTRRSSDDAGSEDEETPPEPRD